MKPKNVSESFSTQPRVETAGTNITDYPQVSVSLPFSTQPRVETAGTWRASRRLRAAAESFSTQPRVETAGTSYGLFWLVWYFDFFQYSTTSRNGWNSICLSCHSTVRNFQYSTTSRNGWNTSKTRSPPPAYLTFSTQPRVETAGTLVGRSGYER